MITFVYEDVSEFLVTAVLGIATSDSILTNQQHASTVLSISLSELVSQNQYLCTLLIVASFIFLADK